MMGIDSVIRQGSRLLSAADTPIGWLGAPVPKVGAPITKKYGDHKEKYKNEVGGPLWWVRERMLTLGIVGGVAAGILGTVLGKVRGSLNPELGGAWLTSAIAFLKSLPVIGIIGSIYAHVRKLHISSVVGEKAYWKAMGKIDEIIQKIVKPFKAQEIKDKNIDSNLLKFNKGEEGKGRGEHEEFESIRADIKHNKRVNKFFICPNDNDTGNLAIHTLTKDIVGHEEGKQADKKDVEVRSLSLDMAQFAQSSGGFFGQFGDALTKGGEMLTQIADDKDNTVKGGIEGLKNALKGFGKKEITPTMALVLAIDDILNKVNGEVDEHGKRIPDEYDNKRIVVHIENLESLFQEAVTAEHKDLAKVDQVCAELLKLFQNERIDVVCSSSKEPADFLGIRKELNEGTPFPKNIAEVYDLIGCSTAKGAVKGTHRFYISNPGYATQAELIAAQLTTQAAKANMNVTIPTVDAIKEHYKSAGYCDIREDNAQLAKIQVIDDSTTFINAAALKKLTRAQIQVAVKKYLDDINSHVISQESQGIKTIEKYLLVELKDEIKKIENDHKDEINKKRDEALIKEAEKKVATKRTTEARNQINEFLENHGNLNSLCDYVVHVISDRELLRKLSGDDAGIKALTDAKDYTEVKKVIEFIDNANRHDEDIETNALMKLGALESAVERLSPGWTGTYEAAKKASLTT